MLKLLFAPIAGAVVIISITTITKVSTKGSITSITIITKVNTIIRAAAVDVDI